mgnify:CR=1 FL=1
MGDFDKALSQKEEAQRGQSLCLRQIALYVLFSIDFYAILTKSGDFERILCILRKESN